MTSSIRTSNTIIISRLSLFSSTRLAPASFRIHGNPARYCAAYSTARSVRRRILKTLDPSRFRKSDFMDLSSRQLLKLTVIPRKAGTPIDKRPFVTFYHKQRLGIPFPSGTHGFLYYHTPPSHAPATAGELRFRVTRGSNSTSFSSGIDLLLPNGLPWCISLLRIAQGANTKNEGFCQYQFIRQILMDDDLVTPALLKKCAEMVDRAECPVRVSSIIIHSLGQLFPVNFHTDSMSFVALHNDGCQGIKFQKLFLEQSKGRRAIPYHGTALCCFELSPLPSHAGSRTIVMRIVRITSPVRCLISGYDNYLPRPTEGGLVMNKDIRGSLEPWSINVDQPEYRGLQGLFSGDDAYN